MTPSPRGPDRVPDLFARDAARLRAEAPLAVRMRPEDLDEYVGQAAVTGPGTVLRRAIEADQLSSLILWGPPGSGKTTLARIIAQRTKAIFVQLSAVSAGVAEVRRTIAEAHESLSTGEGRRTILFLDEIHRFNRGQQDALLPAVEDGIICLIGATTENPYFEVTAALVSRCRVIRLEQLCDDAIRQLLERALEDSQRGLGRLRPQVTDAAIAHLVRVANGDARIALSALETAVESTAPGSNGTRAVDLATAAQAVGSRALRYDKAGDGHYDAASAFIKSMRGSDPDATVYWLARMIEAGEDPVFIARRIVIAAAEEVGNADPQALVLASAAAYATTLIGLPEARIHLAQAAIYVACAPKSNASYRAIDAALSDVRNRADTGVPLHLRNAPHPAMAEHGYGRNYLYPPSFPGHIVNQDYLPADLTGTTYYQPTPAGLENEIKARLEHWHHQLTAGAGDGSIPPEGKVD